MPTVSDFTSSFDDEQSLVEQVLIALGTALELSVAAWQELGSTLRYALDIVFTVLTGPPNDPFAPLSDDEALEVP